MDWIAAVVLWVFIRKVAFGKFVRISHTPKEFRCHFYGAQEGDKYMSVIFKQSGGGLEVHAKAYKDSIEAAGAVKKEMFARFCQLPFMGSLRDDLKRVFVMAANQQQKKCQDILGLSTKFIKACNRLNKDRHDFKKLPLNDNLSKTYGNDCNALLGDFDATRIVMHPAVFDIISRYAGEMKIDHDLMIRRLMTKRPLTTYNYFDWLIPRIERINGKFTVITVPSEHLKFQIQGNIEDYQYLNYDEALLSNLLVTSSPVRFVSKCKYAANNNPGNTTFIKHGYITRLGVPRFISTSVERQFVLVSLNSSGLPEGPVARLLFNYFFNADTPWKSFAQISSSSSSSDPRYVKFSETIPHSNGDPVTTYFDTKVFKKLMRLTIIPFILDAEERARKAGKQAILLIPRWGFNYWNIITPEFQEKLKNVVVSEFLSIIGELCEQRKIERNISDILFNFYKFTEKIDESAFAKCSDSINFRMVEINAADYKQLQKIVNNLSDKILIYATGSHGNVYAGREYWKGKRDGGSDEIAATCSTYADIQNPLINTDFVERYAVLE